MDADRLIEHMAVDGAGLADAAERAGLEAAVPGTEWTVRELVTHVGGVHRWAADIVRTCGHSFDTDAGEAVGTGPSDADLVDWFRAGHAALVDALRAAPADLDCASFLPADSPRHFWARRQAHETAVHRADAQAAAGDVPAFDTDFAQDGIAEMLRGFAARRSNAIEQRARIQLQPSDGPSWLVTLGGERIVAEPNADANPGPADTSYADVRVAGTSSALYLWLWNRPAEVVITGDEPAAALWRGVRVTWS